MKKQLKKPFLMMAVTALVLVGTLKVGGAMAYFTTYSTASGSVQMNMGFTQTIPHEEVDSRGKHVSVENTGDYDCFVRVRAFAPSDITLSYQPEDSGWTDGGDGFWYYDQILPAGETTATKLNVSYTFPATVRMHRQNSMSLLWKSVHRCFTRQTEPLMQTGTM